MRGTRLKAWKTKPSLRLRRSDELVVVVVAHVDAVEPVGAAGRQVEAAEDVHQRALAGAGGAHDRDVLAALDPQGDAVERAHRDLVGDLVDALGVADVDDGFIASSALGGPPAGGPPVPPPNPPAPKPPGPAAGTAAALVRDEVRAPAAALVEVTRTLSPAFRPLTISVTESTGHAGLHALGRARPGDGDGEPRSAWVGTVRPVDCER